MGECHDITQRVQSRADSSLGANTGMTVEAEIKQNPDKLTINLTKSTARKNVPVCKGPYFLVILRLQNRVNGFIVGCMCSHVLIVSFYSV